MVKILFFTADKCPNCKMMYPIWEEVIANNTNANYEIVDCTNDLEMAKKHKVTGIPTFLVTDGNGFEIGRASGYMKKDVFDTWVRGWVSP